MTTHNEMPKDTVEAAKKIGMIKYQGQAKQYCFTETQLENIQATAYNKGIEEGRVEERDKARQFVADYKEKYRGCGMADSMLALDELLTDLDKEV